MNKRVVDYKNQIIFTISWKLFISVVILSLIGVGLLYSAANGSMSPWAIRQFYTILFIIPLVIIISLIDTYLIIKYSYILYIICFILLIIAEILGHKAMGAQRWIKLGPLNIQPSEFMKLAMIISLARFFHIIHINEVKRITTLIIPLLIVLLPVALVLKQPNLGTALILLMIAGGMFFSAGVKAWKFVLVISSAIATLPVVWHFMHNYQKQRVLTFLNPERDPLGAGYNIIQSKIAIGSGGIFGKGYLMGTQNQLSFLPEKQTDFIFTLASEEFGLLGVGFILALYFYICLYCYYVAINCHNQFSRLTCIGVATMIFLHVFINISMISGLLPVVGTPLPFLSYGGSNLISSFFGIALVLNCKAHSRLKLNKLL